jgi:hypothetical protein
MTFFTKPHQGGNIARIQLDATCTVDGWGDSGEAETFHLIAPCRSERMYADGSLFQMPNYEFCGIFTESQVSLIRTHWTSDREQPDIHGVTDRFDRVAIDLVEMDAELLASESDIVAATLANRRLVARTTLRDEETGASASLAYPIKTMNVTQNPDRFQVDTGPLIVPLFESDAAEPIARFAIAHVVYWTFDTAEFVLRRPQTVGERDGQPVEVTDYTEIRITSASHEIWGEVR